MGIIFYHLFKQEKKFSTYLPVVWEVVRITVESPSSVSSYTVTVYFLPGKSSLRFTEVAVRGRSVNRILPWHLKHCFLYNIQHKVPGASNQKTPSNLLCLFCCLDLCSQYAASYLLMLIWDILILGKSLIYIKLFSKLCICCSNKIPKKKFQMPQIPILPADIITFSRVWAALTSLL